MGGGEMGGGEGRGEYMGLSSLHPAFQKQGDDESQLGTSQVKHKRYHCTTAKLPFCIYSVGKESRARLHPPIIPVLRGQARRLRAPHAGRGSTCGQDMKWRQEDHEMRMWVYLKTNNNNKKKREKRNRIVLLICRLSFNLLAIKLIHLCICVSTNESPS